MSQKTHSSRMRAIQIRRGRVPSKAVGRYIPDPLRPGVMLFEVYKPKAKPNEA